ncbi:hypothetical protein GCM10025867_26080 [Frondihabitans sucicola]|uniref:Uncharacterized protein n=1 Tax=Frondihabitans sucicola TaxID=1268041 RepID=A0ABN6XZA0_9MICO|nr:hypothetical protein [Frondihabitans sucicola]BDZ50367.1 hypothetical protein GCM10025867_26080 [Frondihabitans sucicola]
MEDRFRVDGSDLGVDRRRSLATLGPDGALDATVVAAGVPSLVAEWATVPPRILLARVPLGFDGERFGATVDQALLDDLMLDEGFALLALSSRFDLRGRLTVHAGDRLRFVGEVDTPWAPEPVSLDVSLGFGGRRPAAL